MGFITKKVSDRPREEEEKKEGRFRKVVGFAKGLAREVVIAIPRALATPFATTYQDTTQWLTGERPESVKLPFIGEVGISADPRRAAGQLAERALDISLLGFGGAIAKAGIKETAKLGVKRTLKETLKFGVKRTAVDVGVGAGFGAAIALGEGAEAEEILQSAMLGGLIGAVAPPVLGATLGVGIKGTQAVTRRAGVGLERRALRLEELISKQVPERFDRFYQKSASKNPVPLRLRIAKAEIGILRAPQAILEGLRVRFLDRFHRVKVFENKLKEDGIDVIDLEELIQGARYRATGRAENRLDDYLDIRKTFGDDWPLVKEYSHYLDDLDRLVTGGQIPGGRTLKDVKTDLGKMIDSMSDEQLRSVQEGQKRLQEFLNEELLSSVDSGRLSLESYQMIKDVHPSYIPHDVILYLEFEGVTRTGGKSFQLTKSGVERVRGKGSVREIDDIDSTIVRRILKNGLLNEKNLAARGIMDSVKGSEAKYGFIPLRTAEKVKARRKILKELKEEFKKKRKTQKKLKALVRTVSKEERIITNKLRKNTDELEKLVDEASTLASEFEPKSKITPLLDKALTRERRLFELTDKPAKTADDLSEIQKLLREQKSDIALLRSELDVVKDLKIKPVDIPDNFERFKFFRDGEQEEWLIPRDLGRALKFLEGGEANVLMRLLNHTWAGKVITSPARLIRTLATQKNPVFALFSNPVRDLQTAKITSDIRADDFRRGMATAIGAARGKADDLYRSARETGALQGSIFREHSNAEKILTAKLNARDPATGITGKVIETTKGIVTGNTIEKMGTVFEEAVRLGVFSRALKNGLSSGEAAKMARNSTVDFGRSGTWIQVVNRVVPFLNARIQGLTNLGRAIERDPTRFIRQGMYTAAYPATLLTAHNLRYDSYQNIPDYEKRKYWIIMVGQAKGTDYKKQEINIPYYIKIPKGEAQQAISSVVERVLTIGKIQYPDSTAQFLGKMVRDISPILESSVLPPGLSQWVELQTNYSFFRQRQIQPDWTKIEGKWYKTEEIESRFKAKWNTSEVAKAIGDELNWSPIKLDYVIKQGLMNDLIRIGDITAEGWADPEKTSFQNVAELPFVRSLIGTAAFGEDIRKRERELEVKREKTTEDIERRKERRLKRTPKQEVDISLGGFFKDR